MVPSAATRKDRGRATSKEEYSVMDEGAPTPVALDRWVPMQPQRLRHLAPRQTAQEGCGRANSPQPRYDRQAAMQVRAVACDPAPGDQQETMSDPIGRASW